MNFFYNHFTNKTEIFFLFTYLFYICSDKQREILNLKHTDMTIQDLKKQAIEIGVDAFLNGGNNIPGLNDKFKTFCPLSVKLSTQNKLCIAFRRGFEAAKLKSLGYE